MGKFDQLGHGEELPVMTVAELPAASADNVGELIYCSNGKAGAATTVVSNGTNWVYVADDSTVAAIA